MFRTKTSIIGRNPVWGGKTTLPNSRSSNYLSATSALRSLVAIQGGVLHGVHCADAHGSVCRVHASARRSRAKHLLPNRSVGDSPQHVVAPGAYGPGR